MFGAVADELSEAMDREVRAASGLRGESAAALTAVLHTPDLSVKELARFLGMASPSAVELLGRLEEARLVRRRSGPDARTRRVELTASGRRLALDVLAARRRVVAARLGALTDVQQRSLGDALATLLGSMGEQDVDLDHLCRRCDESVCTPDVCPVEYGTPLG
jgi:DNA-binding MarR family transcriptional regulator